MSRPNLDTTTTGTPFHPTDGKHNLFFFTTTTNYVHKTVCPKFLKYFISKVDSNTLDKLNFFSNRARLFFIFRYNVFKILVLVKQSVFFQSNE